MLKYKVEYVGDEIGIKPDFNFQPDKPLKIKLVKREGSNKWKFFFIYINIYCYIVFRLLINWNNHIIF